MYTTWKSENVTTNENTVTTTAMGLMRRQGDVPELLELVGAVDVAGVVELRRHRLQAGQERNGEERQGRAKRSPG